MADEDLTTYKTTGSGFTDVAVSHYYGAPPVYQLTSQQPALYSYKVSMGQKLKDFNLRLKRGELLPYTPWTQYDAAGTFTGNDARYSTSSSYKAWQTPTRYVFPSCASTGSHPWNLPLNEVWDYRRKYDADPYIQKAAADIYSRGWDTLTFAAEFAKTLALFQRTVYRIAKYAASGQLDKIWLEGRYGWRLILYDMKDISQALSELTVKRRRFKERKGMSFLDVDVDNFTDTNTARIINLRRTTTWDVSVRGSVIADIEPPSFAFNPFTTAWELVTLSFVLDWLLNVGASLQAASFLAVNTQYQAAGGLFIRASRTINVVSTTFLGSYKDYGLVVSSDFDVEYTERFPAFVPIVPQIHPRLDAAKVFDLAAIVAGLIKARPQVKRAFNLASLGFAGSQLGEN
jgi:hypothetical protein